LTPLFLLTTRISTTLKRIQRMVHARSVSSSDVTWIFRTWNGHSRPLFRAMIDREYEARDLMSQHKNLMSYLITNGQFHGEIRECMEIIHEKNVRLCRSSRLLYTQVHESVLTGIINLDELLSF
jgi:hypothetical protein